MGTHSLGIDEIRAEPQPDDPFLVRVATPLVASLAHTVALQFGLSLTRIDEIRVQIDADQEVLKVDSAGHTDDTRDTLMTQNCGQGRSAAATIA